VSSDFGPSVPDFSYEGVADLIHKENGAIVLTIDSPVSAEGKTNDEYSHRCWREMCWFSAVNNPDRTATPLVQLRAVAVPFRAGL
jgi:hypothetical protein